MSKNFWFDGLILMNKVSIVNEKDMTCCLLSLVGDMLVIQRPNQHPVSIQLTNKTFIDESQSQQSTQSNT